MDIKVQIGSRRITNPVAKFFFAFSAWLIAVIFVAVIALVVLPLIGAAVSLAVVIAGIAVLGTVVSIPLMLMFGRPRKALHQPAAEMKNVTPQDN